MKIYTFAKKGRTIKKFLSSTKANKREFLGRSAAKIGETFVQGKWRWVAK